MATLVRPEPTKPEFNATRANWDLLSIDTHAQYEAYWKTKRPDSIPTHVFEASKEVWLEIGAGTGHFFEAMAKLNPEKNLIALERDRMRGKRLERRTKESGLTNFWGIRGNVIPPLIAGIPSQSLDRIYILYPAPWPKNAHRKHRWFYHPIMPHLIRVLKDNGLIIWASDQKFYIEEANFVCTGKYALEPVLFGEIAPNPWNGLEPFPTGRTSFEKTFLEKGQPCFELIVKKTPPKP